MNRSWFPILLVAGLLGLLVLLATLQYQWLGQISRAESERLERNLQTDTNRFAEDFNREIQNAYFNFQLPAGVWRERNWNEFNQRYNFWREKTQYPNLIKDFYFTALGEPDVVRYNPATGAFETARWTEDLNKIKPNFADEKYFNPIADEIPALLMPIHFEEEGLERIMVRTKTGAENPLPPRVESKKYGVLIIELNPDVIKNELLPNLVKEYFSSSESADYNLAVTDRKSATIFQTQPLNASDASARLLDLSPDNFIWFANREVLSTIEGGKKSMVFSKLETKSKMEIGEEAIPRDAPARFEVKLQGSGEQQPRVKIFESSERPPGGAWTLNVQHSSGSLEQFIASARRKNLAVSFGILSILAVSVIFIFLSAQRAKLLAQRQVDFVSSVSHEFRTPLAVIYSAGENLADGVANEREKVSRYGDLIKHEGKKLSSMVEQILEFAGARSGKRKYDLRPTSVEKIVGEAIDGCQSMIDDKGFSVETSIPKNLPPIAGDEKALTQAVQNLIANALKYGSDAKWLRITADNGGKKVKIAVEDKGIGIEKREIGKVFQPFFRSKSVIDAQIHGNGLGLSLVKQIVEAHKGEIRVESEIGKGSRFIIYLPLNI